MAPPMIIQIKPSLVPAHLIDQTSRRQAQTGRMRQEHYREGDVYLTSPSSLKNARILSLFFALDFSYVAVFSYISSNGIFLILA